MTDSLSQSEHKIVKGWYSAAEKCESPHFDLREHCQPKDISLLVIHNISLPAGEFGGPYITDLFLGQLDKHAHASFNEIYQLRVSAHCLIRRDGHIIQYVSFDHRAWHAGVSEYQGKSKCNDFSIGIELEGTDNTPYTDEQYLRLAELTKVLKSNYQRINANITGHCDIAPERKTDPGPAFDWQRYKSLLNLSSRVI
ncbi:1,6-anhydro-N-acetylmuramyl-L-alanine amidase AmpD [Thalassotalea hakodatensis]|uniref:1,6-anhydro-N-acetylmuramyl-L-alanine amidase AmpD n=1 Tax=Thalassotalea hakodatensis TaxID=3030492 RepID=UPI0025732297|nr:1,6-anhydro-N-acetylmuramyl-L-alanine amidase AmpD [Thalassotalea hakodatensis]